MNIFNILIPKLNLTYLNSNDNLQDALDFLIASGYTAIPVIDDKGLLKGVVSEGDFLRAIIEHGQEGIKSMLVRDIMHLDSDDYVLNSTETDKIMEKLLDKNFLSVIDDRDIFIGIITRRSVMLELKN